MASALNPFDSFHYLRTSSEFPSSPRYIDGGFSLRASPLHELQTSGETELSFFRSSSKEMIKAKKLVYIIISRKIRTVVSVR